MSAVSVISGRSSSCVPRPSGVRALGDGAGDARICRTLLLLREERVQLDLVDRRSHAGLVDELGRGARAGSSRRRSS